MYLDYLHHYVVVITTAQLHSTKSELWFSTTSNPAGNMSEICNGENLTMVPTRKRLHNIQPFFKNNLSSSLSHFISISGSPES